MVKPIASPNFLKAILGLMGLHALIILACAHFRTQGPIQNLKITSSSGSLILFGHTKLGLNAYLQFETWNSLNEYLVENNLELPRLTEVSKMPPHSIEVTPISEMDGRPEYKILWSQNGNDRNVIHLPDLESAQVFRDYVYYNGLESSHLGFSLPLRAIQ